MTESSFRILHDTPSSRPALDFGTFAAGLSDVIMDSRPRFAIGIFGGWGSGKTTLMQEIERRILQGHREKVITLWFSAWRYEREEHLIVPLLDTLREALVSWADERRRRGSKAALETASTVGKVIYSLLSGVSLKVGVPGAVDLSFDANKSLAQAAQISKNDREEDVPRSFYHASFRALQAAFGRFTGPHTGRRIVVFVDDLDRCLPESALQVLESMKLFFDLEGFVFVVGLDRDVVESIIDSKYVQLRGAAANDKKEASGFSVRGSDYIKKIFQVPFSLRPVAAGELDSFLQSIYDDAELEPEQRSHFAQYVHPHLEYLVTSAGINPREVKRYLNAYTLLVKMRSDLTPERLSVLLALQTIDFRPDWQTVRRGLYAYRRLYLDALRQQTEGDDPGAVERLSPQLGGIPASFLRYVAANGPGRHLLYEQNLNEFIYIGEAVRSTIGSGLADVVQEITRLRDGVQAFADSQGRSDAVEANRLKDAIKGIRHSLQRLGSSSGPGLQPVTRLLEGMERSLATAERLDRPWEARQAEWQAENDQRINEMVDRLTEMVESR